MRIAILGLTYGFVIWLTGWLEVLTGANYQMSTGAEVFYGIVFGVGLGLVAIEEIRKFER